MSCKVTMAMSKLKPKTSSGKDNISTKLLKEIIESIVYPIDLFNLSFKGLEWRKLAGKATWLLTSW